MRSRCQYQPLTKQKAYGLGVQMIMVITMCNKCSQVILLANNFIALIVACSLPGEVWSLKHAMALRHRSEYGMGHNAIVGFTANTCYSFVEMVYSGGCKPPEYTISTTTPDLLLLLLRLLLL